MGKIIAVINHKGGVGKTATTANLGAVFQKENKKVLLIDLDGQANLTQSLGINPDPASTIYQAMRGEMKTLPVYTNADGLKVVPSCLDLSAAETELLAEPGREIILKSLIGPVKKEYDYILIDCPPSLSLLTLNAMTAADSLIIPVQSEFLAIVGMAKLMNVISTVRERLNPGLEIEGIVMTLFDSRKNFNQSSSDLVKETFPGKIFDTIIRSNVSIGEATAAGRDVLHYAPKSNGATDYTSLGREILNN